MMAEDRAESTWVTISYGSFIKQLPPDTIEYALMKKWCPNTPLYTYIYIILKAIFRYMYKTYMCVVGLSFKHV